ncbi:glycosyltransferase family 39 protein [Nitrosomonas sp. PY1]|uniref:glycosyltransferase family 39 protein n=1 Tax=Nitrosomonas sp. PY1 TaxID=1803906 RepID=UPI001FC8A4C7|nr:glycosyltransferase family 39 protein [Nitrosomonas sp. PY1]
METNITKSKNSSTFPTFNIDPSRSAPWMFAFIIWLATSVFFLAPLWSEPTLAVQNDDYWSMSEYFHSLGPYPFSHFGPGFPFLIYLLRSIGIGMLGVVIIQKVAIAFTGIALYHLGRTIGLKPIISLCAATAFTVFPVVQAHSSLFLTETFYLLFSSIGVATVFHQIKKHSDSSLAWLTLGYSVLGIAALIRGNAMILLIGCLIIGLFTILPKRKIFIAGIIAIIPILSWSALNWYWYGHFKLSSSGDAAVATSIIGPVMAKETGMVFTAEPEIWFKTDELKRYDNLFELSSDAREIAINYAIERPLPVIIGNIKGWFHGLLGPGEANFRHLFGSSSSNAYTILSLMVRGILLIGLIGFFVIGGHRQQTAFAFFVCVMLVAHLLTTGAAGHSRFGYPIDAFSVLALAFFLQHLFYRKFYRKN